MPRDEPSFIVAPCEFGELGAQFVDGFERPHPEQVLLQGSVLNAIPYAAVKLVILWRGLIANPSISMIVALLERCLQSLASALPALDKRSD